MLVQNLGCIGKVKGVTAKKTTDDDDNNALRSKKRTQSL